MPEETRTFDPGRMAALWRAYYDRNVPPVQITSRRSPDPGEDLEETLLLAFRHVAERHEPDRSKLQEGAPVSEENKALIRRFVEEAFNEGNLDVADEVYAGSYTYHGPGEPEERTPEGARRFVAVYRAAFPDLHTDVEDVISEGDTVAYRWTARGTHGGELMGVAPTGNAVTITGITVCRVSGGRVVEEWNNFDRLGMMQQLGVVPEQTGT